MIGMDITAFNKVLWPEGNSPSSPQVYALLDGARDERIARAVWSSNLPFACLYAGRLSAALQAASPYLVQLAPQSRFVYELLASGWGQAWGVFLVAPPDATLPVLRKHCRGLLRVKDEQGRMLLFRYHDPRVLRAYLPTCTPDELAQFFGPVHTLFCENQAADALLRYDREAHAASIQGYGLESPACF